MSDPQIAPYGSWKSPITAELITRGSITLGGVSHADGVTYWLEGRPAEAGRMVIVRRAADGTTADVTPPGFNARTRVQEYGGGAYLVREGVVYFSNFEDQRLYRHRPGEPPAPITPEPRIPAGLRYADGRITPDGRWLICVREEHHEDREATNTLIAFPPDGSAPPKVIAGGHDFYSNPRVSPDGKKLCWLAWDHPNMPWDGTGLYTADLGADASVAKEKLVAGGPTESVLQPEWSAEGVLHFVSDRTGWWNLYALRDGAAVNLTPIEAEFGLPGWVFGMMNYTFLSDRRIACVWGKDGRDHLGIIPPGGGKPQEIDAGFTQYFYRLADGGDRLYTVAGRPDRLTAVVGIDLASGQIEILKREAEQEIDPGYLATPRHIEFPTENGLTAHAQFYPPTNKDFRAPDGARPPLIVGSHGGPTGSTSTDLDLGLQFWTSRGFAVVDVDYGGSTGYGRAYRNRLIGQWGLMDMDDCINAAKYLVGQGEADPDRLIIRGGSAGGYTTLCALTFRDTFKAGASYFGIGDMAALSRDTHKFESRYLDVLVGGTYPAPPELLHERSPIHFADRIACPVIILQGMDDKIVTPNQAEQMAETLKYKELPYALLMFEGEGHGFRKAENIKRALESELYFYGKTLGFEIADQVEPVEIENL